MSTRYTVRLRCRVDRRCPQCRATYRTVIHRGADADADTPEDAARTATRRVSRELAAAADPHPCPACGRLPTDVFNRRRAVRHGLVTAAGVLLLVLAALPGGGWAGLLAAAVAVGTAAAHAVVVVRGTNVEPDGDPREDVELLTPGDPDRPKPTPAVRTVWHLVGVLGTLAAAVIALTPAVAVQRSGKMLTVRPGEPVRVEFAETVDVVGDDWTGNPKVTVRNRGDFPDRVPDVRAESRRTADRGTDEKPTKRAVHPWADLTAPEDPALTARPIELRVELDVRFGPDRRTLTASRDVTLAVAPGSAAGRLRAVSVGTVGLFLTGLMVLAAGLFLRTLAVPEQDDRATVDVDEVAVAPADRDARPTATGRTARPDDPPG